MLHLVQPSTSPTQPRPDNEARRLEVLKRYDILDTPPEVAFDRITALAAGLFDAPISVISFLDTHRLWFKSHHGIDTSEVRWGPGAAVPTVETMIRRELGFGFFVSAPVTTSEGYDLGALCVVDRRSRRADVRQLDHLATLAALVTDRLELRRTAVNAAARADLLAREIDHRAMNSLQLIASLLNLQSRTIQAPEAARQLTIAANRVLAVARVHRNFSANESVANVPVLAYLRRLCGELAEVLDVAIDVEGEEASAPTKQLLAIGLVVNELATNATKHGAGPIKVTFMPGAPGQYELCVLYEGDGLPAGFAVDRLKGGGLGIRVVAALVAQLEGHLTTGANPAGRGACFTVTFPSTVATDDSLRHLG